MQSRPSEAYSESGDYGASFTHGSVNWEAFEIDGEATTSFQNYQDIYPRRSIKAADVDEYVTRVAEEVGAGATVRGGGGRGAELRWWKKLVAILVGMLLIMIVVFIVILSRLWGQLEDTSFSGDDIISGRAITAAGLNGLTRLFKDMDMDGSGAVSMLDFMTYMSSEGMVQSRGWLLSVLSWEDGDLPIAIPSLDETAAQRSLHAEADQTCSKLSADRCADNRKCFPHHQGEPGYISKNGESQQMTSTGVICTGVQEIECFQSDPKSSGYPEIAQLLLVTSDGLSNNNLRNAFRHLVMQLPKEVLGEDKLQQAKARSIEGLGKKGMEEAELYRDLQVLLLYDGCGFKELNTRENGKENVWHCEDFTSSLKLMGFEKIRQFSMLDLTDAHAKFVEDTGDSDRFKQYSKLREDLFLLQRESVNDYPTYKPEVKDKAIEYIQKYHVEQAIEALSTADVIAANGGNVDWFTFLMTQASPDFLQALRKKLQSGRTIYLGQSAGAMAVLADIGVSTFPAPNIGDNLLQCMPERNLKNMLGIQMMSRCALRPHFEKSWAAACDVYERSKGIRVIRAPNGVGMLCSRGDCKMVGMAHDCNYDWKLRNSFCKIGAGHAPHQESVVIRRTTGGRSRAREQRLSCAKGSLMEKFL